MKNFTWATLELLELLYNKFFVLNHHITVDRAGTETDLPINDVL